MHPLSRMVSNLSGSRRCRSWFPERWCVVSRNAADNRAREAEPTAFAC
jgi:hypothetical protein